jgi:hypothetical protein
MVPNIKMGASFRGAMLYYLHDKRREAELLRFSDERVAWTATRNCAHDTPELAFAEMIATAESQEHLKQGAGERLSGRPMEQPVMTISLSWHPSEKPDRAEMERAADSYLKHMGLDEHQAVYAAHNDTEHAHVHIIVNRIHPETGKVHDDAFSKNRSQVWARGYEQERGHIWCQERVGKDYTKPNDRPPRGLPNREAIEAREEANRYAALEQAAQTLGMREKVQLARRQQEEREAFLNSARQQFREARQAAYREVRREFRERWAEHFREADILRKEAERNGADMATHIMQLAREEDFAAAWQMCADRDTLRGAAEKQIGDARQRLRGEQRAATRERQDEACKDLYDERALAFVVIKQGQKEERAELKALQAARADERPYDRDRLADLVERAPMEPRASEADRRADHELVAHAARESPDVRDQLEPRPAGPEPATLDHGRDGPREKQPHRDLADGLAGGIAKAAEIVGNIMEGFLSPETPQEKAAREALARVIAETAPEREATEHQRELDQRQAAYEQQKSAQEKFDEYFARHGDRIRREEEEHQKRTKEHDR